MSAQPLGSCWGRNSSMMEVPLTTAFNSLKAVAQSKAVLYKCNSKPRPAMTAEGVKVYPDVWACPWLATDPRDNRSRGSRVRRVRLFMAFPVSPADGYQALFAVRRGQTQQAHRLRRRPLHGHGDPV